jgi:hypothetical protein
MPPIDRKGICQPAEAKAVAAHVRAAEIRSCRIIWRSQTGYARESGQGFGLLTNLDCSVHTKYTVEEVSAFEPVLSRRVWHDDYVNLLV